MIVEYLSMRPWPLHNTLGQQSDKKKNIVDSLTLNKYVWSEVIFRDFHKCTILTLNFDLCITLCVRGQIWGLYCWSWHNIIDLRSHVKTYVRNLPLIAFSPDKNDRLVTFDGVSWMDRYPLISRMSFNICRSSTVIPWVPMCISL